MKNHWDAVVIGGGLSGLVSAIQLIRKGASVALFDKGTYPRNRVCGEFLSGHAIQILEELGIQSPELKQVPIDWFVMTNLRGSRSKTRFPESSYGVSRYWLENELARYAQQLGVKLFDNATVNNVKYKGEDQFEIQLKNGNTYVSRVAIGAFGKRSHLQLNDLKRTRFFAVKNYYQSDLPANEVSLNLFQGGYAGLSKVETGYVNCCYMGKISDLKRCGSIVEYEDQIVKQNPNLRQFFKSANPLWEKPMSISQIYFGKRKKVDDGVLHIGDAAGMIFPLSGNGMTIAVSGALRTATLVSDFLNGRIDRKTLENEHRKNWNMEFSNKLLMGKGFQFLLEHKQGGNLAVPFLRLPLFGSKTISLVHG